MKKIVFSAITMLLAFTLSAQERWQADVSVTSVTLTDLTNSRVAPPKTYTGATPLPNIKCSITIHNENDDDAWNTMLVVSLPVEVSAVTIPSNATLDKSVTSTQHFCGNITFNIGHIAVGQNVTVEFTFTKSKYTNKVGAFAYSDSPDPNPANNYKDATL
jgi:hypothetical protein